jgi:uncharacterized phage protein (TIGR01671 family)
MELEVDLRAWDGQRMIYLSDLSIGLRKSKRISPYAYFAKDTFGGTVSLHKHKLMQFIGMHDGDNQKIYTGDIVENLKDGYSGVVAYSLEAAQYHIVWKTGKVHRYAPLRATYGDDAGFFRCDYLRKIGNIHENPSLVKSLNP